ncbi:MAG: LuxR C-terminal-related transcriptional regulator [Pseudomonadota bacterium]|nr:LuxR C-terminal-related transcriptional regulator [Pseudomonadota bacterium]
MPRRRPVLLLLTSADGSVQHANAHASELLGRAPTCRELVRAEDGEGQRICSASCAQDLQAGAQHDRGLVTIRRGGYRLVCSALGEGRVITMWPATAAPGTPQLSPREKEVLELVAVGLTSHRIARRLGITEATVRTHVEHIRDKLGVRTRSQAVARALALGQIE